MATHPLNNQKNPPPAALLRNGFRATIEAAGDRVDAQPWPGLCLLLLLYGLAELGYSLASPLWHDELFTFYIAQAPSVPAMLAQIRAVDLNPPLSYLLTRASFHLFGVGTLQCRLPEIAGFALALIAVFLFVRRRADAAFGLLAAALLFGSRAGELVFQARPYGLMLGCAAVALACWQGSADPRSRHKMAADLGLLVSLSALLSTHIFGLFPWAAITVAEGWASVERRSVTPRRLLALLLPLAATLLYLPMLRSHAHAVFPAAFQPTGSDIFAFYMGHVDRELITLGLSAAILAAFAGRSWLRPSSRFALTTPEWVALSGLLAAPLLLIAQLILSHGAFFDRYGVIACLGTAILFAVLFQWWTGGRAGAALVATLLCLLITLRLPDAVSALAAGRIFRHTEPVVAPMDTSPLRDRSLPLVTASGLTFLEMQRREPEPLLQRTFYLTDEQAAITYAHANIFEGLTAEAQLFPIRSHVEPYRDFLAAHSVFYVLGTYDYPEQWLLRKLTADGASLQMLGRIEGSYKDHELYLVDMRHPPR